LFSRKGQGTVDARKDGVRRMLRNEGKETQREAEIVPGGKP